MSRVALLDEVEQRHPPAGVPAGDGHDEAQVGLDELTLGLHVATLDASRQRDLLLGGEQRDLAHLAEVHAYRVARRRLHREVELDVSLLSVVARRGRVDFGRYVALHDVDAEVGEDAMDLLDLLGGEIHLLHCIALWQRRRSSETPAPGPPLSARAPPRPAAAPGRRRWHRLQRWSRALGLSCPSS